MRRSPDSFDVGVVGGGPAGATAATTLARSGLRVLLVEHSSRPAFKIGEGLPPAATPLLRDIGVSQHLEPDGHLRSYGNESAWGGPELQSTLFLRDPNGQGWHLDRARFDARLRDTARDEGARVRTSVRMRCARRSSGGWQLTLDANGRATHALAAWLIDCTGRSSSVARANGGVRIKEDRLVAWTSRFSLPGDRPGADDIDSTTLVESAPHGWWYTALVPPRQRVVVYLTDANDATAREARTADGFMALLKKRRHLPARVIGRGYTIAGRPIAVAANTSRLVRAAGDGWIAAGDAALAFDPLSSQGILTALYSGLRAAQAVASHLGGDRQAIPEYLTRIDAIYAAYLEHRRRYYGYERRWLRHEFWRNRCGARAVTASV